MVDQKNVFIILEWQEQGPIEITGDRLFKKGREICVPDNYPKKLPCHNPECEGGGFEIGAKISALLSSGRPSEQNSLICTNAVHKNRDRRCLHIICYSITRVLPYAREKLSPANSGFSSG